MTEYNKGVHVDTHVDLGCCSRWDTELERACNRAALIHVIVPKEQLQPDDLIVIDPTHCFELFICPLHLHGVSAVFAHFAWHHVTTHCLNPNSDWVIDGCILSA